MKVSYDLTSFVVTASINQLLDLWIVSGTVCLRWLIVIFPRIIQLAEGWGEKIVIWWLNKSRCWKSWSKSRFWTNNRGTKIGFTIHLDSFITIYTNLIFFILVNVHVEILLLIPHCLRFVHLKNAVLHFRLSTWSKPTHFKKICRGLRQLLMIFVRAPNNQGLLYL
jgi:hypothetical protein